MSYRPRSRDTATGETFSSPLMDLPTPSDHQSRARRIGGASALLANECPRLMIQALGRWASDYFILYCRQHPAQRTYWLRKMLNKDPQDNASLPR